MIPPPGIVGANIHIQGVVTVLHQQLGSLHAFVQITADLLEFLAGQSADTPVLHHALGAVTQSNREVLAAAALDFFHDLLGKTQAVFQASAVLVGTVVKQGNGKLVDQVALVHRMNLHAVKASTLGVVSTVAELLHDGMNLFHGEGAAGFIQPAVRDGGGCHRRELAQVGGDGHTAETAGQLQKHLCAISVDALGHLTGGTHEMHRVVGGAGAAGHGVLLHLVVHKGNAGDDQAGAALGALGVVVDAALVEAALCVAQAQRAHGRHGEAVLQLTAADAGFLEQICIRKHLWSSLLNDSR